MAAMADRLPRKNDPASIAARPRGARAERRASTSRRTRSVAESVTGVAVDPRLGRAAPGLARRVRAVGRRRGRRDRPRRGGGRRPARAHRGRADRVGSARREGGRAVRRLPHVRRRRPDHARVVLRLQGRRRRADARALDRASASARCASGCATADIAELSRYARPARGRRRTSSGRCATCSGAGRPATRSGRT